MKLEIDNLVKNFGNQRALTIDQFSIDCSTLAILGPSGSGKSTLLKMIAGLLYPDSGTLIVNDQKLIFNEKALRDYRKTIGIVFQSYNLFPHLSALENIMLPLIHVQNKTREEAYSLSMDLLKRFTLAQHAQKKPHALSGGQIQRVALIRAIAIRPKLLILDEPTSALDPLMTYEVQELILELKKENQDILMVSHHLPFVKKITDQVLFISDGKIRESGPTEALFSNPRSQQAQDYMSKVLAY